MQTCRSCSGVKRTSGEFPSYQNLQKKVLLKQIQAIRPVALSKVSELKSNEAGQSWTHHGTPQRFLRDQAREKVNVIS